MTGDDEVRALLPHNPDTERLSLPQRVAALEATMALVAPQILGQEAADGSTRPGVLRRLELIERWIKWGSIVAGAGWVVTTFGLAPPIKHAVVVLFGGG